MKQALLYAAIAATGLAAAGALYVSGSDSHALPAPVSKPARQVAAATPASPPTAPAGAVSFATPARRARVAAPHSPIAHPSSRPERLWEFESGNGGASTMVSLRVPQIPQAEVDADSGRTIVRIAPDWRSRYPFSERFPQRAALTASPEAAAASHVVDLAAIRFATDALVSTGPAGQRIFADPDLRSFSPNLVGKPFEKGTLDYFIVQANTPGDQASLRAFLETSKISILDYLPDLAYLVRTDSQGLAELQLRKEIFWVGLFHPAYRIEPRVEYVNLANPSQDVRLTTMLDPGIQPDEKAVGAMIRGRGINLVMQASSGRNWMVRTDGPVSNAHILATLPGALWVERYVDAELHNDVARTSSNVSTGRGAASGPIMDVEDVWARGIRGEGQIAAAADTGLSTGDITTPNSLHFDFGQVGSATNPMRVIKCYALARAGNCNDDQTTGGGHGTHTSGSFVGNGIRSGSTPSLNTFGASHAGVAPKAQFVFQSIMNSTGGLTLPADLNTMFLQAYNDGARVHSNSWGAAVAGQYNANAQQVDQFSWNYKDMVITFSAGNEGVDSDYFTNRCVNGPGSPDGIIDTDSVGSPGTAKNCITVGASENYRPTFIYEYPAATCTASQNTWSFFNSCSYSVAPLSGDLMADNANGMGAFSSRGPTDDGRVKPDIVAPGIAIISTRTNVNQAYEQWGVCNIAGAEQPYYVAMGGTSMANPLTAGAATLVRQYYVDGWHPNNSLTTNAAASGGDGFNPTAALVKATLINGAWDMAPGQYGTGATKEIPPSWDTGKDLPNNAEGYGRVDLEHSLFPGSGYGDDASRLMEVHDVTTGLTTGQTTSYTVTVSNPNDPLIATLVWTDPYGATAAATELVNNLDLKVTSGATTWYPNKKDNTAGSVDTRNNVEQVYISAPSAGTYTVTVAATSVPGNGVSLTNAQPYALVVSGVLAPPCTPPAVPTATASAGPGAATITVSWNTVSGATGYKVYRSDGACPGGAYTLAQTINSGSTTQWADTTVTGGNIYSYKVSSTSACESSQSACSSATAPACSNPTAPGATVTDVSVPNTITLTWTASPTAGVTYTVYRASSCAGPFSAVATGLSALTYSEFDVPGGTTRAYQIAAVDSGCETRNACVTATAGGGPAVYSSALTAKGTPQNTSAGQPVRWIYAAAATSLNPLTLNSAVYAASNDRKLHSMTLGGSGGMWPRTTPKDWKPLVMNAPSQARVPVANLTVDVAGVPTSIRAAVVASQDGRLYLVNADTGALVWSTGVLGDVLQAAPGGYVRAFDPNAVKLANDILIIGTRNSSSANVVYGLNAATGATLWTFTNGGGANALGVINGAVMTDTPNHRVYFATRKNAAGSANTLWCLSFTAASASLVWSADIGNVDSSPILKGTSLYVGNNVGTLYKFDTASGTPSTPLWSYATDDGPVKNYPVVDWSSSAVYASTTNRVWRFVDNGASTTLTWSTPLSGASSIASPSSAMLYATAMYVGTSNGNIVKLTNLTAASPTQTVIPVGNTAIGALAFDYSNNLLHAGSEAGTIYAVTP